MQRLAPLYTAHLFRPLLDELLALLQSLTLDDWERPTLAPAWRVRDIAAHLLDGDLRRLSATRDAHLIPAPHAIESDRDLTRLINGINASGVAYAARLSPRVITDLLVVTGGWVAELVESLPPHGRATFPVSWAGESVSEHWMDIGREYTERWHHQMQIRDAVGARGRGKPNRLRQGYGESAEALRAKAEGLPPHPLLDPRLMRPLLDLSVRALPPKYAGLTAAAGSAVTLEVHGETTGTWSVVREADQWHVYQGRPDAPDVVVRIAADDVWRLFYNALLESQVPQRVEIKGNLKLAEPLLRTRSVIV